MCLKHVNWVFKIRIQFNYVVTLKKRVFLHCYPSTEVTNNLMQKVELYLDTN